MRKTLVFLSLTFVFVLMILTSCGSGVKGTYYEWDEFRQELEKDYSIIFGSKNEWSDTDGFSGTYELDGSNITLYVEVMGFTEVLCSGTIGNGKFEYVSLGSTYTYYKEGFEPKKEEIQEPTLPNEPTVDIPTGDEPTEEISTTEPTTPEVVEYTVEFDSDGGTQISNRTVESGSKVNAPTEPLKEGYIFEGWYYGDTKWDFNNTINGNITLKAKWKIISYSITFDINGHGEQPEKISNLYNLPEELPTLTENGYVFFGWYLDSQFVIPAALGTKLTSDITLYAKWHKLNENESVGLEYQGTKLVGIGTCADEMITIPNFVTEIGRNAFADCTNITNINIPNSITKIENNAFKGCTSLERLNIPLSVTSIGGYILTGCVNLKTLTIPFVGTTVNNEFGSLFYYGYELSVPEGIYRAASYSYFQMASYHIPSSLVEVEILSGSIRPGAFYKCKSFKKAILPSELETIPTSAFEGCESIEEVIIPSTVKSIGEKAFKGCTNLLTVYNDSNLVIVKGETTNGYVGYYATNVYNKDEWEYIDGVPTPTTSKAESSKDLEIIGTKLTGVGQCTDENIIIPEGVTEISQLAFQNNVNIKSIFIPSTLTVMDGQPFLGCINLEQITVHKDNPKFDSRDNCNAIIETSTNNLVLGCNNTVIPNETTIINPFSFAGRNLTTISIPNSITKIKAYAFFNCANLLSIIIPENVNEIEYYVFNGCSKLNKIVVEEGNMTYDSRNNCNAIIETTTNKLLYGCKTTIIPSGVTHLESVAFDGCDSLISITIPKSVIKVESSTFSGCLNLSEIIVEEGNIVYDSRNNCNAIIETTTNKLIVGCKTTVIPSDVIIIGPSAFYGQKGLTEITIPVGVTKIDYNAFGACENLSIVIIESSTLTIDTWTFYDCANLRYIYNNSDNVIVAGSETNGYLGYYATNVYNKGEWEYVDGIPTPKEESIE